MHTDCIGHHNQQEVLAPTLLLSPDNKHQHGNHEFEACNSGNYRVTRSLFYIGVVLATNLGRREMDMLSV